jgi:hypothetical protein
MSSRVRVGVTPAGNSVVVSAERFAPANFSLSVADLEFVKSVGSPVLTTDTVVFPLSALDLEFATNVGEPALTFDAAQFSLLAVDLETAMELGSPALTFSDQTIVTLVMNGLAGGGVVIGDHASVSVTEPTGVTFVSQAWGFGIYGDDARGTGSSPSDLAADDTLMLLWEALGDNGTAYRASAQVRKPLAVPGANLDLSFQEGVADTQDLLANWTLNDNTMTFVSSGPALPAGVSVTSGSILSVSSGAAAIADASYNLNFEDEYGAVVTGVATIEITAEPVTSDPIVSSSAYNPPGAGDPAELDIEGQYPEGGTDTLTLYGVTLSGAITPDGSTEAQIIAGSGVANALEYFSVPGIDFAVGRYPVTGLTAASEAATHIAYFIAEDNDGGSSGVQVVSGVTGMDFTPAAFTSAEIGNINDTTLRIVFDGPMYGALAPTDLVLTGNTIAAVDFTPGDDFVDVTLGTAVTSSDDYTGDLSYIGSDLTDDAAVPFPTFASQNVTNNVSAPAPSVVMPAFVASYGPSQASNVYTQAGLALGAGEFVIGIAYQTAGSARTVASMVVDGQTLTAEVAANDLDVSGVALYRVTTTNSSWDIVLTMSGALGQGVRFYVWGAGSGTAVVATNSSSGVADLDPPINQNINTETGGKVIGIASVLNITDYDNLTGVALVEPAIDIDNNDRVAAFEAAITTGETPRTVSIGGTDGIRHAIAVLSLGAA